MYGFVNQCIEQLVVRNFGNDTWEKIKEAANVHIEGSFLARIIYSDDITYALLVAAERILNVPLPVILEMFGVFYFQYCREKGYDKILASLGSSPKEFLENLDALHDHLQSIYPGMRAPSFRCTSLNSHETILHYYSDRPLLEPIVIGLVKVIGKELYNRTVECTIHKYKGSAASAADSGTESGGDGSDGHGHGHGIESSDHVQFLVSDKTAAADLTVEHDTTLLAFNESLQPISPAVFCELFPFSIVFDRNLRMLQVGSAMARVLPAMLDVEHSRMDTVFELQRPRLAHFAFNEIYSHVNGLYVLQVRGEAVADRGPVRFRGGMYYVPDKDFMLFIGSPNVSKLDELRDAQLFLNDIPLHDSSREVVLLHEQFAEEYEVAKKLEILTEQLQQFFEALDGEKKKTDRLLYDVLPPSIANELKQGRRVPAQRFPTVTILFTGLVGFADYCARHAGSGGAERIVHLLNTLFTAFDSLLEDKRRHHAEKVYKIETVLDHYLAVSGLPIECDDHARAITNFALDLQETTKSVRTPEGEPVQVTFGIHTGEVVTGIIGDQAPRYCLFGNTVNLASRTQTTGDDGQVNITESTYNLLCQAENYDETFCAEYRGEVKMKGRATPMKVYFVSRTAPSSSTTATAAAAARTVDINDGSSTVDTPAAQQLLPTPDSIDDANDNNDAIETLPHTLSLSPPARRQPPPPKRLAFTTPTSPMSTSTSSPPLANGGSSSRTTFSTQSSISDVLYSSQLIVTTTTIEVQNGSTYSNFNNSDSGINRKLFNGMINKNNNNRRKSAFCNII